MAKQATHDLNTTIRNGDITKVTYFLDRGCPVDYVNEDGETSLHIAAKSGNDKIITLLLNKGAKIDARDSWASWTALHHAVWLGATEVVRVLIQRNADKDAQDKEGQTPLHLAAMRNRLVEMLMLLESNANINTRDQKLFTALHTAASFGSTEIVTVLLQRGADKNAKSKDGKTPKMLAESGKRIDIVNVLTRYATSLKKPGTLLSSEVQDKIAHVTAATTAESSINRAQEEIIARTYASKIEAMEELLAKTKSKGEADEKKRIEVEAKLVSITRKCHDLEIKVGSEEKRRKEAEAKVRALETQVNDAISLARESEQMRSEAEEKANLGDKIRMAYDAQATESTKKASEAEANAIDHIKKTSEAEAKYKEELSKRVQVEATVKEDQKRGELRNKNEEKLRADLQARVKELEEKLGTINERRASERRTSGSSEGGLGGMRFLPKFRIIGDEEEAEGRRKLEKAQEDLDIEVRRRQKAEQSALAAEQKLVTVEIQLRDYEERFKMELHSNSTSKTNDYEASSSGRRSGSIGLIGGKLSEVLLALRKEESKRAEIEAQLGRLLLESSGDDRTPAEVRVVELEEQLSEAKARNIELEVKLQKEEYKSKLMEQGVHIKLPNESLASPIIQHPTSTNQEPRGSRGLGSNVLDKFKIRMNLG